MIKDVVIQSLKVTVDEKGKVMHMLRSDNDIFKQFGEIYFSQVNSGYIKGWKKHLRMTQHFTVPVGSIKLVLFDNRDKSDTKGEIQEIILGIDNYNLVRIPPLIFYSFKALGNESALIANCTDLIHDPNEGINIDLFENDIPYNWSLEDK